jgi:iron(III) transport system permease protein
MAAAPIVVLLWLAASPSAGWDTLAHLAATVLPSTIASTLMLAAVVLAVVLVVGVGSGWLVAAYDFPGRRWLAWALVLPLSMPAFVLAYAYTDFFDTSGPFQSWLRGITGWAVREYWFPDIRSLPGAGFVLGLALIPTSTCWRAMPLPSAAPRLPRRRAHWECTGASPGGG